MCNIAEMAGWCYEDGTAVGMIGMAWQVGLYIITCIRQSSLPLKHFIV